MTSAEKPGPANAAEGANQEAELEGSEPSESDNESPVDDKDGLQYDSRLLRRTTSLHDDYLHRGPFRRAFNFYTSAARVTRIRKSEKRASDCVFNFDSHYPLATLFCQQLRTQMAVPRLVSADCPPLDKEHLEEHARFKLMLFAPVHCAGSGDFANPLNFAKVLFKSKRKVRFAPVWRAQCAEIRVELERASTKLTALHKIHTLKDTSLCRAWWPDSKTKTIPRRSGFRSRACILWATAKQLLLRKHGKITGHIFSCLSACLGIPCGWHPAQLHIEEFLALGTDETSRNFNLQSLAKTKPLKDAHVVDERAIEGDESDMKNANQDQDLKPQAEA